MCYSSNSTCNCDLVAAAATEVAALTGINSLAAASAATIAPAATFLSAASLAQARILQYNNIIGCRGMLLASMTVPALHVILLSARVEQQ
jgi:hypothetical protein